MWFWLMLFHATGTVFQCYIGDDMVYELRKRKPESSILSIQGIFNLLHHIGTVWEKLAFDDAVNYAQ